MIIRKANIADFEQIVGIYNQAIPHKNITADLEPVSLDQRKPWFDFHLNSNKYPIWVVEAKSKKSAVSKSQVLGWGTFSPFYLRAAFDETAEISVYFDKEAQGKGLGSKLLQFMQSQMTNCHIKSLMAYVIEENHQSRKLFEKNAFTLWGRYPNIANMGDKLQTFLMYGFQQGISV